MSEKFEYKDIEHENWREYVFPDGSKYRIDNPKLLCVRKSGAHMVVCSLGWTHYIKSNYNVIVWSCKTKDTHNIF